MPNPPTPRLSRLAKAMFTQKNFCAELVLHFRESHPEAELSDAEILAIYKSDRNFLSHLDSMLSRGKRRPYFHR